MRYFINQLHVANLLNDSLGDATAKVGAGSWIAGTGRERFLALIVGAQIRLVLRRCGLSLISSDRR